MPNGSSNEMKVEEATDQHIKELLVKYNNDENGLETVYMSWFPPNENERDIGTIGNKTDSEITPEQTLSVKFKNIVQYILNGIKIPLRNVKEKIKAKKQSDNPKIRRDTDSKEK